MAQLPMLTDYVDLIMRLFTLFDQYRSERQHSRTGRPYTYSDGSFIVLFIIMHYHRIFEFKAQRRWLDMHPEMVQLLGWERIPHRTTISRRYKALYGVVVEFMLFISQHMCGIADQFDDSHLVEDKSLFRARGPVWHQKHRRRGYVPTGLRCLDTEASWGRSAYHGWVYGYAVHMTCNEDAFPVIVCVETASVSESEVLNGKEDVILKRLAPRTLSADDAYTKAMRIRHWFQCGVALVTPALRWTQGRFAQAYHRFIELPESIERLRRRRTSVEPLFDLIGKVLGADARHNQLPVRGIDNVRPCLALGALSVQIAMVANHIWGLPPRNISNMAAVFQ